MGIMRKSSHRTALLLVLSALVAATAVPLGAADFLFTWNASPDPDLNGYRVYQRTGDSTYELLAAIDEPDLDDPSHPSYLVTGLQSGFVYHFAASSVSVSGTESDLSGQTCITVNGEVVQCQDDDETGATIFISCFITAVRRSVGERAEKAVETIPGR
jgi:hypothetical protein